MTVGRRVALLVASYDYQDPGLRRLTAPAHDAESLAAVLRDPDVAGFDVTILVNEPHHRVGEAIGSFYRERRHDDLTLLYFTGHGLKDDAGRLYLAMSNTRRDSLLFTALSAGQIDQAMEDCASRQMVLILDCCYSGAYPAGRLAKADTEVHALQRFQGTGRTVLTASDSTQYSFEGNQVEGEAAQSVFTRYLVEGLREGTADPDGDGDITVDELYSYVHDRVVEEMPQQRPKKQVNVEGRTVIARNVNWSLPSYLRNAVSSPIAADRLSSLAGLEHLHRIGNDAVRARVRDEIHRLAGDDSRQVSAAATQWLRSVLPPSPGKMPGTAAEAAEAAEAPGPATSTLESAALGIGPVARSDQAGVSARDPAALPTEGHAAGAPAIPPGREPPGSGLTRAAPQPALPRQDQGRPGGTLRSQRTLAPAAGLLAVVAAFLLIIGAQSGGSASVLPHVLLPPALVWCVAALAAAAGACAILPRTRSLIGPGALLGLAAASAWGLVYVTWELGFTSGGLGTSARAYGFELAGHLVLLSAAGVAGVALRRDPAAHFGPAVPRDLFRWTALLLGALGMLALLGQLLEVVLAQRTDDRFGAWAPASITAAVLALAVPALAVVTAPRRLQLALLSGWVAGGVPILLGMFDLADGNNSLRIDSHLKDSVLQVPVLGFGCTLLLLAAAAAWLRHPDPLTGPGPDGPAPAEVSPDAGPRRRTVIAAGLAIAGLPVAVGSAMIGLTNTFQLITALAISRDGSRLYCTNLEEPASIWVIDTMTRKIIAGPTPVGPGRGFPYSLAVSPDDLHVYVTLGDLDSVLVIDTKSAEPAGKPIPVGKTPVAAVVSPDGRRLFVVNEGSNDVSVIDTATNEPAEAPIPIGYGPGPAAVAVSPDGSRVYVAAYGGPVPSVSVIDTRTGKTTGHPIAIGTGSDRDTVSGIAVSPDGRRLYVAQSGPSPRISVIDTTTGKTTGHPIPIGPSSESVYLSGIGVSPDGRAVYVIRNTPPTGIWVIATLTNRTDGQLHSLRGFSVGIAVSPDGRRIYTGASGGVALIDVISGGSELIGISP